MKHVQLCLTSVATLLAAAASPALAQKAYFSLEGEIISPDFQYEFNLNLSRDVDNSQPLEFQTFLHGGGTNAAGKTFVPPVAAPLAIDPELVLFDSGAVPVASNDDGDTTNDFDSLLSWAGVAPNPNGGTPIPSPIAAGDYVLDLHDLNNDNPGVWALDLVGPADALSLGNLNAVGTGLGNVTSFKFGTIPTGMGTDPAVFNSSQSSSLSGHLVVGQSGSAVLNHTAGIFNIAGNVNVGEAADGFNPTTGEMNITGAAVTQTGFGRLNVGSFPQGPGNPTGTLNIGSGGSYNTSPTGFATVERTGTININPGGTFNANAGLVLNEGDLNLASGGDFNLAAGTSMNAIDGAAVSFNDSYELDDNTTFLFSGGAAFTSSTWFDIGNTTNGTLTVTGSTTTFTTNTNTSTHLDWGIGGGTANVTVTNTATADFRANRIDFANDTNANSNAKLDVTSSANVTTNNLALADGNAAGTATINVKNTAFGFGPSTLTQNGSSTLVVGGTGTGSATVNVTDSGVFNTGTGDTTVHGNGIVNTTTTGRFNANGNVVVNPDAAFNLNAAQATVVGTISFDQDANAAFINGWALEANAIDFLGYGGFGSSSQNLTGSSDGVLRVNRILNTDAGSSTTDIAGSLALGVDLPGTGESAATHTVSPGKVLNVGRNLTVGHTANASLIVTADASGGSSVNLGTGGLFVVSTMGTATLTGADASNQASINATTAVGISGTATVNAHGAINTNLFNIQSTGILDIRPDSDVNATQQFRNFGGTLRGEGRIDSPEFINHGHIRIDTISSGILFLPGNYFQNTDGTLELQASSGISGPLTELRTSGSLTLAGALAFSANDPLTEFAALTPYGMTDDILFNLAATASDTPGVFETVSGHVLSDGTALAVLYGITTDIRQVVSVQRVLYGDGNRSGQIEQGDLDAVLQNWGKTSAADGISWVTGDYNGSGQVEQGDLDAVLQNWGDTLAPDFTGYEAFAVPEPTTAALLAGLALTLRKRPVA